MVEQSASRQQAEQRGRLGRDPGNALSSKPASSKSVPSVSSQETLEALQREPNHSVHDVADFGPLAGNRAKEPRDPPGHVSVERSYDSSGTATEPPRVVISSPSRDAQKQQRALSTATHMLERDVMERPAALVVDSHSGQVLHSVPHLVERELQTHVPRLTRQRMCELLERHGRCFKDFAPGQQIIVRDRMQRGGAYSYVLHAHYGALDEQSPPGICVVPPGSSKSQASSASMPCFAPDLSPQEMLARGVFEGRYLNDCLLEFPREWFYAAGVDRSADDDNEQQRSRLAPDVAPRGDVSCNAFGVRSRLSLPEWRVQGLLDKSPHDARGWFQWYCRYWCGRRDQHADEQMMRMWIDEKSALMAPLHDRGEADPVHALTSDNTLAHRKQAALQWGIEY